MARSIIDRLKDFSDKLKSGEPIKATQVTVEHTPDGNLTTRMAVELRFETFPQRFRWRSKGYARWKFGVMLFNCTHDLWEIHTFGLHPISQWDPLLKDAHTGPAPEIEKLIGDVSAFHWIDSDLAWAIVETK